MIGLCPACKRWTKLTRHHDKQIKEIIMICRGCHNIIEEYAKAQARTQGMTKAEKTP